MSLVGQLLLAVLGGFAAAVATRLLAVPAQVRLHDRQVRDRDRSLRQWVADEDIRLSRQLRGITNTMAAQGQLYAGVHGYTRAAAKELALHRWRDEGERAAREVGAIKDSEGLAHRLVRGRWSPIPELTAFEDQDLLATITAWEDDEVVHGGPAIKIANPSRRPLVPRLSAAQGDEASVPEPRLIHEAKTPTGGRRFAFHLDPAIVDEAGNPDPTYVREYEWGPFSRESAPLSQDEQAAMSDEEFEALRDEVEAYYWDCSRREASGLADGELRRLRGLPAKTYEGHPQPPWRSGP